MTMRPPPPAVPDPRKRHGQIAESLAALCLELDGYTVLGRNVRCAGVEIDLVARVGEILVLVEVKLRRGGGFDASQALGPRQVQRQRRAAAALLERSRWAASVRHDLVGIDWSADDLRIHHLRGVEAGGRRF
jgi:putative endonuclease